MNEAVRKKAVWKLFRSGLFELFEDAVLEERRVILTVDGREEASVVLTPGNEDLWALGYLSSRRMILSRGDILSMQTGEGRISVVRRVKRKGISPQNRFVGTVSPGFVGKDKLDAACKDPLEVRWDVPYAAVEAAVEELSKAPLFRQTGSVHVALLADKGGGALFRVEDAGRHNAMDKAVGWAVRNGVETMECFLAVSGRLPDDMVCKAFGARVPLLASVSAATASGIEAAENFGITLVGFVREGRMNVYSVPERLAELASAIGD